MNNTTHRMRNGLIAAGLIIAFGLTVGVAKAIDAGEHAPVPTHTATPGSAADIPLPADAIATLTDGTIPPCATEDSDNCYWDAAGHNGRGRSFITIAGTTYYATEGK